MGINKDLKDKAAKVVHVQSYEKGVEQEKGVTIPERLPIDRKADVNKKLLNDQVRSVVNLILTDREPALQQIMVRHDRLVRENTKTVLLDPASQVAVALADVWVGEGIDLPNVDLYEGMCGYEKHTWFRAGMTANLVSEPDYFYVIDPWGRGVSVVSLFSQESDIVVLKPWSPFHITYAGKPIRSLALVSDEGEEEDSNR